MFDNIGKKIKGLVTAVFVIEVIFSIILGIILMAREMNLAGILVMASLSLIAWISSFFMYGFGELVEDVHAIRKHAEKASKANSAPRPSSSAPINDTIVLPAPVYKNAELAQQLYYALQFQTESAMINALRDIDDPNVRHILRYPANHIRAEIKKLYDEVK